MRNTAVNPATAAVAAIRSNRNAAERITKSARHRGAVK
uniref:Uncharacterized protein n=1 Tax=viral metagenome TaxID=1070528 RepID=A0A6C0KMW1_9ZZZZ